MKKILILCLSSLFAMQCNADQGWTPVASKGSTLVKSQIGKSHILVTIANHEIDIGKPSDPRPQKILSSCTYARFPCSAIDYLEITINEKSLFIARSIYADLADINRANLQQKNGNFILTLEGGDASEGYKIEIVFNEKLIKKRIITGGESEQVTQETTYFAPAVLDN